MTADIDGLYPVGLLRVRRLVEDVLGGTRFSLPLDQGASMSQNPALPGELLAVADAIDLLVDRADDLASTLPDGSPLLLPLAIFRGFSPRVAAAARDIARELGREK